MSRLEHGHGQSLQICRISDAVWQCIPDHQTRNREGLTAELRATVTWNDELVAASRT